MAKSDYEKELECRILHLETQVKHLTNDLWITGEENETATANYLEIHSNMEKKIHDRTKDLARTANELRESEERYRFLVEESNDIIWTFDLSSMTYTYFSNSAEKILGYPPEVGRVATLGDVFSPPTKKQVMSAFSKLLSADGDSTRILMEAEHRHKDGGTVWMEINALLHRDSFNKPECLTGVSRDITERKQAEAAKRENERFLKTIVENIPDMIFVKNAKDLRFVRFNKAGEELLGYSREELLGKNDYDFFPKEEANFFTEKDRDVLSSGKLFDIPEELIQTKDKGERILHTKKIPIINEEGMPQYLLGISEDITERKRLESQLRQSQKMAAISTLTGGIAHDYNNLLSMIMGNLSMAREEAEPHSVMAGFLQEAEQASSKARDLTHQLMTLSRGGYPMKELGSIESLLKEIPGQIQAHEGVEYTFSIQDDLWALEYDSKQMQYVISNVLINAVEAMPRGEPLPFRRKTRSSRTKAMIPECLSRMGNM